MACVREGQIPLRLFVFLFHKKRVRYGDRKGVNCYISLSLVLCLSFLVYFFHIFLFFSFHISLSFFLLANNCSTIRHQTFATVQKAVVSKAQSQDNRPCKHWQVRPCCRETQSHLPVNVYSSIPFAYMCTCLRYLVF